MALRMILGPAGSGKSTWLQEQFIRESLAHPEQNFILLVPEQYTMETQMQIVKRHPHHGTLNIDVLSFERLAFRVFEEAGCADYIVLDDMGKNVILSKVAREYKKQLKIFGRNLSRKGFISELKSLLSELYQYGIGADELEKAMGKVKESSLLSNKIKDMVVIYRAFADKLSDGTITAEEVLTVLCRLLPNSRRIRNVTIGLDGFTGFTPVQYQVLDLFMQYACQVDVTVTADADMSCNQEVPEYELHYLSSHTVFKLQQLAKENQTPIEPPIRLDRKVPWRFDKHPALAFLERHILRFSTARYMDKTQEVSLHISRTPLEEVRYVCREIHRLVQEKQYRYRDIAVITGSISEYACELRQEFVRQGIPFFLDDKRSFMTHPLVEYIRSALEVVVKDFSYESVFRHLKCGLFEISLQDRDKLENYVIAMGIRGRGRWQQDWNIGYAGCGYIDFVALNKLREAVITPLLQLYEQLKKPELTVKDFAKILVCYILDYQVDKKLLLYKEQFEAQGDYALASEYEQAQELLFNLFDEVVELLGEEQMSLKDFSDILDSGLEEIQVGTIPAYADRLVAGDMERTRLSEIKALFFLGNNEGKVPKVKESRGLFTDYDKEQLNLANIELSPTVKQSSFIQRFYLYLAFTRAKEVVYISYAKMDSMGKSLRPSVYLSEILHLFPKLSVVDEDVAMNDAIDDEELKLPYIDKQSAWRYYLQKLQDIREKDVSGAWKELYSHYCRTGRQERARKMLDAAFDAYQPESIGAQLAKQIYGEVLSGSVSRLEQQASCAYAQFLIYGLGLKERREFAFKPADIGTILHKAIEAVFQHTMDERIELSQLSKEDRETLVHTCMEMVTAGYDNQILKDNYRNRWLNTRLENILNQTIWALGEQLKGSGFQPKGIEVQFSSEDTESMMMQLETGDIMKLRGRIDRMDSKEVEDKLYIRVVDYKSGSTSFDLVSVYYGLQLQLVFYLDAAIEYQKTLHPEKEICPGGILYYNIKDPIIEQEHSAEEDEVAERLLEQMQMNGLENHEVQEEGKSDKSGKSSKSVQAIDTVQFAQLKTYVQDKMKELGTEILSGSVTVNPYQKKNYTSCQYCQFQTICGFDRKRSGYQYRNLPAIKDEVIWNELDENWNEKLE